MADYNYLRASNGAGDAALMHVTSDRSVGSTTINVDSTTGLPTKFIATSGTSLPNGLLDPATMTNFKGHLGTGTLEIDGFEPGTPDVGNVAGQVIIIKPTTGWVNRVAYFIENLTGYGTPEALTFAGITATAINAVSLVLTNNLTVGGNISVTGNILINGTSSLKATTVTTADGSGNVTPSSQIFTVHDLAAAATINLPTFAPAEGMTGILRIRDNGTAQGLSWQTGWAAIGVTLPTQTLGGSKNIFVSYGYFDTSWCVLGISRQG